MPAVIRVHEPPGRDDKCSSEEEWQDQAVCTNNSQQDVTAEVYVCLERWVCGPPKRDINCASKGHKQIRHDEKMHPRIHHPSTENGGGERESGGQPRIHIFEIRTVPTPQNPELRPEDEKDGGEREGAEKISADDAVPIRRGSMLNGFRDFRHGHRAAEGLHLE